MGKTYAMLTDTDDPGESVFRSLTPERGLRLIDHHKDHRADGPLFIAVIA